MRSLRRRWRALVVVGLAFQARSRDALAAETIPPESDAQTRAPEPATAPVVETAPRPQARHNAKRFVVARDFGVAFPVGQLAEEAATMYGPIVRVAYHLNDRVEIGGRIGYQRGFDKQVNGVARSLSSIPVYATVRWFPLGDRSGPYGGVDLGVNVFRDKVTPRSSFFDVSADATWVRPSANIGIGWVLSRAIPIDLRAQLAALDLASEDGLASALTIGVIGGYSIFF